MEIASPGTLQGHMPSVFARLMAASRAQGRRLPEASSDPAPLKLPGESDRKAGEEPSRTRSSSRNEAAEMHRVQQEVSELKRQEQRLRAHELAHLTHAGPYARGGMQFSYERGPDGALYATSGEVNIDTSPIPNDPEATLRKAQLIQRAALAPAEPSAQDRTVAARATQMAAQARVELMKTRGDVLSNSPASDALYASVGIGQGDSAEAALNLYA